MWSDLGTGILEEFASACRWRLPYDALSPGETQGLVDPGEGMREAYRRRHEAQGLCRSCVRPTVADMKVCHVHRAENARRARESKRRRRCESK